MAYKKRQQLIRTSESCARARGMLDLENSVQEAVLWIYISLSSVFKLLYNYCCLAREMEKLSDHYFERLRAMCSDKVRSMMYVE